MSIYYLDASALVKRYLWEAGSHWLRDLLDAAGDDTFASTELITVEVVCALTRAEREKRISLTKRDKLTNLCLDEIKALLDIAPASADILQNATQYALRHPLRAYDAVHLATALELTQRFLWSSLPAPIFVTADANLLTAARAEGLTAKDPNEHE